MIIKRLILHNFGIYAGTNVFEFTGKRPVVLVGGNNGRGKTTFLEAVLLALYGSNSFLYRESDYSTYQQYLKSFVNTSDSSFRTYIQLDFDLDEEVIVPYSIKRSWRGNSLRPGETLSVMKNGKKENFLENNWLHFIEGILPSGIARFFFFDGEKIAELARNNSNQEVKDSIRTLLGLSVIDQMEKDFGRIMRSSAHSIEMSEQNNEYENIKSTLESARKELEVLENRAQLINEQILSIQTELQDEQNEFVRKGGDISRTKEEKQSIIRALDLQVREKNIELKNLAAGSLPLRILKDDLAEILKEASVETNRVIQAQTISQIKEMADEYKESKRVSKDYINDFLDFIENKYTEDNKEPVYSFSKKTLEELEFLVSTELDSAKGLVEELRHERSKALADIDENNRYLDAEIDEQAIETISESISEKKIKLGEFSGQIAEIDKAIDFKKFELSKAVREYQRASRAVVKTKEWNDKQQRTYKYSLMSLEVLERFKEKLQIRRTRNLGEIITQCYLILSNKKNLISHIEVDPMTLDLTYRNSDGVQIPPESLSAGEQQLMVISLLWALAKASKRKLPVIVDTPLSRLDSSHRKAIVSNYYPAASNQIIILSTDTEITSEYYEILKPYIDEEYSLMYDEILKATTIQSGFFKEENYDRSTDQIID